MSKIVKYVLKIEAHMEDGAVSTTLTRDYAVGPSPIDGIISRDLLKWSIQTDQHGHESIHINASKPGN